MNEWILHRRHIYEPTYLDDKVQHGNGLKVYQYCNIYGDKTKIGDNVKIGAYTEINNATIGNNVTIGNGCFIPEGVTIEDDCWIGPRVVFTNDRFPPSDKDNWETTLIKKGVSLGAGVTVLCGITVGENSLVGAGSVVTKCIPPDEIWCGVPVKKLRAKEK